MKYLQPAAGKNIYQAPTIFVAAFYLLLAAWTIACVSLMGLKAAQWGWTNLSTFGMIAFILVYTWYFSVAISYKIEVKDDGFLHLKSFRRTIETDAGQISLIEGPRLPVGFLRFRLKREKAYLFCVIKNEALKRALSIIRSANPEMKVKGLQS